ncbi:hypothetical protein FB567DRAFT_561994 [Paraphoma chrysanthemicola]|uniref:Glycosyl transferase CAP10 domain-containing protein n=1 Tax=Paraphoma chrysanthemicola TaxID=798071 RepID=A0A8K0VW35_9PLEO|nr:hypothetical protein FB567DRAFT_561994 [Paraphoma chrysanthemicola]
MHPVLSLIADNVSRYPQLFVPLLFTITSAVANVHEPVQYSLLIAAASWATIWVSTLLRVGIRSHPTKKRRWTGWVAGACLAFAQICDRAACDKEGIWLFKSLLPFFVTLISKNEVMSRLLALPSHDDTTHESADSPDTHSYVGSFRILAVTTVSAVAVLLIYTVPTTSTLGVSSVIFTATGLLLFGSATGSAEDGTGDGAYEFVSTNQPATRSSTSHVLPREQQVAAVRDIAASLAAICGLASILIEPTIRDATTWQSVYRSTDHDAMVVQEYGTLWRIVWTVLVHVITNFLLSLLISDRGALDTSLVSLFSVLCAKLSFALSFSNIWFTALFTLSALFYTTSALTSTSHGAKRSSLRIIKRIIFGVSALSIGLLLFRYASNVPRVRYVSSDPTAFTISPPPSPFEPVPVSLDQGHPASQLVKAAEANFQNVMNRQSASLADAVHEYRRRYGIAPPPHFDKWYEFARRNDVVLIDEFDTIQEALLPFWALDPATIRSRITRELGGEDSALIGVAVRDGQVVNVEKGEEWQRQATASMMEKFVEYLPDMDLGFNIHDEPRVVVPNDLLSSMVNKARIEVLPRTAKYANPRNAFSARPKDMNDGKRFVETYVSKFNRFAHQQTWTPSRLSCPAGSQAQTFEDYAPDNVTAYAAGPLSYIYNTTAFTDICISPSLSSTFGFFERPNAFNIIHELTPVFSQSKISSFQDILYPSPWYWVGKVGYDESHDTTWENKTNALYWRGSTTGGFSRNGGWRRQHRQHIVQRLNAPDKAQMIVPSAQNTPPTTEVNTHKVLDIDRRSLKHLIDVHFSHVGQCDPGDCDAQKEFFQVTERADGQDAWYFKHLLDMDGNAFSGRFYSFLKSQSLTYKMAIFREWHAEWLQPWVHYIPLSLKGDEHLDLVRWFSGDQGGSESKEDTKAPDKSGNGDTEGEKKAREIAKRSSEWHDRVLRKVDFEAWFFRLLLEYGRVIDDNREEIGYPGP